MLFDLDREIDERRYLLLMFALQASEASEWTTIGKFRVIASETLGSEVEIDELEELWGLGLVRLLPMEETASRIPTDEFEIDITSKGVAVLINGAGSHLDKVIATYEVPDGTAAALVPLLDVRRVPAADRYVSTADNQELFSELAAELDRIKAELVRDQNQNELPIPLQEKRGLIAELDGLVGQIKAGYVRLSDLTQRARPIVKNIADTCKDVGVIGAIAYSAYEIIARILVRLF